METLDWIAKQEYLGRGILIGRTINEIDFISYFVTGRSAPSQARKLVEEWDKEDRVRTECTDEEQLKKGTPELLIYNAMRRVNDVFIVSNGAQTDVITDEVIRNPDRSPGKILIDSFVYPIWVKERVNENFTGRFIDLTSFEPDPPNFTPRISGVLKKHMAAFSIAKNTEGIVERQYFEFPLITGRARFISTYTGKNVPKGEIIPSFRGEPLEFDIRKYEDIPSFVYAALGPKKEREGIISPGDDFRVGLSTVYITWKPI
ncbi:hypothetical protein HYW75_00360, partial [Candidatus Pacearchaeota archaeon]|nr:hypothetical protein [Candidatus Pacearchaeota archaeon]